MNGNFTDYFGFNREEVREQVLIEIFKASKSPFNEKRDK